MSRWGCRCDKDLPSRCADERSGWTTAGQSLGVSDAQAETLKEFDQYILVGSSRSGFAFQSRSEYKGFIFANNLLCNFLSKDVIRIMPGKWLPKMALPPPHLLPLLLDMLKGDPKRPIGMAIIFY